MKVRFPNNAGSWYAGSREALLRQIEKECFLHRLGPGRKPAVGEAGASRSIAGLLCPHAGYMYSGPVAAYSYGALASQPPPRSLVIVGPNHTGLGSGVSMMVEGAWRTPLGDVPVDSELAMAILRSSAYIDADEKAHQYEHSIELQLPFLQYLYGARFKIVPICMLMQDLEVASDVGKAIGEALQGRDDVALIASSDMTHYEPHEKAARKDAAAVEAMERLDEVELIKRVTAHGITMCGPGPTAAVIYASKKLGAKRGRLLKYATSGDTSGDRSAVVGYCAMAFAV